MARKLAELDDVRLHDLRHSYASLAAGRGVSLQMIGKLLGHKVPATTERYAHLARDAAAAVNDELGAVMAAAIEKGAPARAEVVKLSAGARPVADFDLFRLGLALDALPPSPRNIDPLNIAQRLSGFLTEWWQVGDDGVSLAEAFRLLPTETVTGVVLRALAEIEGTDPRYWSLPALDTLLPKLQVAVWQQAVDARLLLEAVPANGSRHRALSALDLPFLVPDFSDSRLLHDGRVVYAEVRVRQSPAPVKRWREEPSSADIEGALINILSTKPDMTGGALETALYNHFDGKVTRETVRAVIKKYAPQTIIRPGRPKKNSPN